MGIHRRSALLKPAFLALNLALVAPVTGFAQAARGSQTIVTGVEAQPVNAGINPHFSAVEVSGSVLLGSNPCMAAGNSAELVQRRRGKSIVVTPVVYKAPDDGRVCAQIYDPVYVSSSTVVRVNTRGAEDVYVANVDEFGNTVRVYTFR